MFTCQMLSEKMPPLSAKEVNLAIICIFIFYVLLAIFCYIYKSQMGVDNRQRQRMSPISSSPGALLPPLLLTTRIPSWESMDTMVI